MYIYIGYFKYSLISNLLIIKDIPRQGVRYNKKRLMIVKRVSEIPVAGSQHEIRRNAKGPLEAITIICKSGLSYQLVKKRNCNAGPASGGGYENNEVCAQADFRLHFKIK